MAYYRKNIVDRAKAWLGCKESDGSQKKIIDVYNGHKPLARGYVVKYSDAWCATFVSACAIKCGYTTIIPTECGCNPMIALFKKIGCWEEKDAYIPFPGDIIFYDWDDNGVSDNTGSSDHVGIVEKVSDGRITVIEGNYSNSVKRRYLSVNGRYIRGYGVPKYDAYEAVPASYTLKNFIKDIQRAFGAKIDGIAGPETLSKTITLSTKLNNKHPAVYYVQRRLRELGYTEVGAIDGSFGPKTKAAVKHFQKDHGRTVDGEITARQITWKKLLGMA